MKYADECMGEVKALVDEVLNVTEIVNVLRTDWLPNNEKGENDDKIKSVLNMLCKYCIYVEARARKIKNQIEKDEGVELEYDI